jgi:ABC-2 type transport system permease protein
VALEMDQTIGVSLATWGRQAAVLALVPLVAGGAALLVIRRQMRRAA